MPEQRLRHGCQSQRANRISFPAADPQYRAARMKCALACRNYNNQREDVSPEERASLWRAIVTSHEPVGSLGQDDTLPRQLQTSCTSASLHEETQADYESNNLGCKDPATSTSASYSRSVSSHALLPIGSTATGSRIGPFSIDAQSPPPSPGIAQVLLELCPLDEDPTRRASVDTPPPSRRASLPSVLVRETPPLIGDINVSSEVHELPISTVSSTSESRFSDPFVGTPYVKPPIYIDYGVSLKIAASTFVNRNFTVVDSPAGTYSIGERCLIGPNVTLAGVGHPLDAGQRGGPLGAPSYASDITILDDCWIGANAIILGGVTIGAGCVIGAGSVVTRDIPAGHLALGVPARVIRRVTDLPDEGSCQAEVAADAGTAAEIRPSPSASDHSADVEVETNGELPARTPSMVLESVALRERVEKMEKVVGFLGVLLLGMALHILA